MKDFYKVLGVEKNASDNTIKQAYKKLAMQHHPDKHGGDDTMMKQINEAYDTLKNPETRRAYDNPEPEFHFHRGNSPFQGMPDEIFEHIFGGLHGFRRGPGQYQQKNRDLKINLTVTLDDLYKQEEKHVSVKLSNGKRELVKIALPAHIENGQTIRYPNLGDNEHPDLTRGDLYVRINIAKHEQFEKKGLDLFTSITIDCIDAMLGTDEIIKTLSGKNLKVKIPAGTQFGTVLNLNNEGMQFRNASGNMLVQVLIKVPKNLSEEKLELVKQLKQ